MGFCLSEIHLCHFLSLSLLNNLPHSSHFIMLVVCSVAPWSSLAKSLSSPSLLYLCLDVVAASYHSSSSTLISLRSFLIMSLHLLRGPPRGHGWGSQPNRLTFGVQWSGILATCPKPLKPALHHFGGSCLRVTPSSSDVSWYYVLQPLLLVWNA